MPGRPGTPTWKTARDRTSRADHPRAFVPVVATNTAVFVQAGIGAFGDITRTQMDAAAGGRSGVAVYLAVAVGNDRPPADTEREDRPQLHSNVLGKLQLRDRAAAAARARAAGMDGTILG